VVPATKVRIVRGRDVRGTAAVQPFGATGKVKVKVAPCPGALSTLMEPP
jgi:hypothetical protein